jgi:hypothetical protein
MSLIEALDQMNVNRVPEIPLSLQIRLDNLRPFLIENSSFECRGKKKKTWRLRYRIYIEPNKYIRYSITLGGDKVADAVKKQVKEWKDIAAWPKKAPTLSELINEDKEKREALEFELMMMLKDYDSRPPRKPKKKRKPSIKGKLW